MEEVPEPTTEAQPDAVPGTGAEAVAGPAFDGRERTLDPRVLAVWRITDPGGILLLGVPVVALAGAFLGVRALWVAGALLVAVGVVGLWYPGARYRRWRWQLTPLALELRHGVVVRRYTTVPYFRIQQIDVTRGLLERWRGIATLRVTTASASGSASLPGIGADEAPHVRTELLRRAALTVGELDEDGGVRDAV